MVHLFHSEKVTISHKAETSNLSTLKTRSAFEIIKWTSSTGSITESRLVGGGLSESVSKDCLRCRELSLQVSCTVKTKYLLIAVLRLCCLERENPMQFFM